jgi:hypothetical protein
MTAIERQLHQYLNIDSTKSSRAVEESLSSSVRNLLKLSAGDPRSITDVRSSQANQKIKIEKLSKFNFCLSKNLLTYPFKNFLLSLLL